MIVLDCDAAVAIARDTPEGKALSGLMLEGERAIAPQLFANELAHTLEKYIRASYYDTQEALCVGQVAYALIDEFVDGDEFWEEACTEAIRLQHSSYDMFYLVLARRTASTLFTLDKRLQRLCLDNGVQSVYLGSFSEEEQE